MPKVFTFSRLSSVVEAETFVNINLQTIIETILSNIQFCKFFFLLRTLEDFLRMPNLIIVQSPLIRRQSSISIESESEVTSISTTISPKMLQTVDWRFLPSPEDGIPTTSKHYCSVLGYENPSQLK